MNNPLRTSDDYELLLYRLSEHFRTFQDFDKNNHENTKIRKHERNKRQVLKEKVDRLRSH